MAAPGGLVSTTGVAGLTLGGGIGHLSRKYGLACDNLLSAQVVTADGRVLTASQDEHADLFWGLRGGGGNFGVVVSFEFQLHPVSTVLGGPIFYALDQCDAALHFYRDFMADAPEELGVFFVFLKVPPGPPFPEHLHNQTVCGIICCYAGSLEEGEEVVKPLLAFGPPLFEHVGRVPYPFLQSAFDPIVPPGLHHYWKADFMLDLEDGAIAAHVEHGPHIPTVQSVLHIYPTDGAVQRVGDQETAYSHRRAKFVHIIAATSSDPADMPDGMDWTRRYWHALHPYAAGGSYVNFLMDEGEDSVRGDIWRELRTAGGAEEQIRSYKSLPAQPEHQTDSIRGRADGRRARVSGLMTIGAVFSDFSFPPVFRPIQRDGTTYPAPTRLKGARPQRLNHPGLRLFIGDRIGRFKPKFRSRLKTRSWVV